MRRWLMVLMLLVALAGGLTQAVAQEQAFPAMPLEELGLPELIVETDGLTISAPGQLEAGRYFLELDNASPNASIAIEFYRAPDGVTAVDLIPSFADAAATNQPPPGFYDNPISGGVAAEPGRTGQAVIDLPAGSWIAAAFVYGEDIDGFLAQPVEVTGEFGDPDDPDSDVDVNFEDFAFDFGSGLRAGDLVWELENDGVQPHFIAIYTYPGELTAEGVNAAIATAYGTSASVDPTGAPIDLEQLVEVGGSGTMSPDTEAWLQLDLPPGTYLAMCQVADRDSGLPHSALGQFAVFTVE